MPYKELQEVITLGISVGNAFGKSFADGDWDWITDPLNFIPVIKDVFPAIEGISKVDDEWEQMTDEDWATLLADTKRDFDIPDDEVEEFVEDHFELGSLIAKIIAKHWIKKDEEDVLPDDDVVDG